MKDSQKRTCCASLFNIKNFSKMCYSIVVHDYERK